MSEAPHRAWLQHALVHERAGAALGCVLVAVLMPLWTIFDRYFEPTHATEFLVLRFATAVLAAIVFLAHRRGLGPAASRAAMLVVVCATGLAVAHMMSAIDAHYVLYGVGFSLVFWGFGLVLAWPPALTVVAYSAILAGHIALWLVARARIDAATFWGIVAYLGSAAVIAVGVAIARRRLEYRAFVAAHELARKNAELAATVSTLCETQDRLVATEKLSALGRLISQLSHEINNPLNVVQNNLAPVSGHVAALDDVLDVVQRTSAPESAAMQRWRELDVDFVRTDVVDAIATMAAAVERIRLVQSDLRKFMRGQTADPAPADLNDGVRATVAMLRRNLAPRAIVVESYGDLPATRMHVGQVNQVVLNLVQNAVDAVGDEGRIEVATRQEADAVVLTVSDTGPGVSEAARRHLFEPFFTTKDVGKGTGVGLATCYQIVRAHGGSIELDDTYERGARFVVRLPVA